MSGVASMGNITIKNATENNLKNVNVELPVNRLTCVTGPSGCGKSSLVYDTIYAESQRAFLGSMSNSMFGLKLMDKPRVGTIENLRPALNVSQTYYNYNPRSTVGTLSEVSHYMRALFALVINETYNIALNENFFSSNDPGSCCENCKGIGEEYVVSMDLLMPDSEVTLEDGGITYFSGKETSVERRLLTSICEYYGIDVHKKVSELTNKELHQLLYRDEEIVLSLKFKTSKGRYKQKQSRSRGAFVELQERLLDVNAPSTFTSISKYLAKQKCSHCNGTKLKDKVLKYRICRLNIAEVEHLSLLQVIDWMEAVKTEYSKAAYRILVEELVTQASDRIVNMINLKLEYLSIDRSIPTLSGGEIQRLRLANQLNCPLIGLIYILDEPCRGLHERNIISLTNATRSLVQKGNTVIAIEHNKQYISYADRIIELGPVGGPNGGYIVNDNASAAQYTQVVSFKQSILHKMTEYIELTDIEFRNIHHQDVRFPIGKVTCITGVSGSGKSTLIKVIQTSFKYKRATYCQKWVCPSKIKSAHFVNQQPIGKTPRSTVVSYLEIYDTIRDLFSKSAESKAIKLTPSEFSMNVKGGRCEACQGTGYKKIELNYLPDSYIICPECNGKRFSEAVLNVHYKGRNISQILDEPISEVIKYFAEEDLVLAKLQCMIDIGLGYLSLGQMSMNLSGGEAQRIKLAKALGAKAFGNNIYILDEPTSGLNAADIEKFKTVIDKLINQGNTVLMIEHNREFVASVADYIIDFGVNAGDLGGSIVAQGEPKTVFSNAMSSWSE